ncbi:hypothetical protein, partial [Klebsiella sp. JB_Kp027]|uniref:hypothetical protein n=1 Tax=Klebsiella sp. JB_Kp027 TaxID=3153379 RepID=UPI0032B3D1D2
NPASYRVVRTKSYLFNKAAGDRSKDKNLSLINGDNERTIVDHAPFVGSIVPVAVRFFQANIEEG